MRTTLWALRLATNHIDHRSDSIDRQSRLHRCTALVTIGYILLTIACFKLASMEAGHQHSRRTSDVHFVLVNAPVDLGPKTLTPQTNDLSRSAGVLANSLRNFFSENRSELSERTNSTARPVHPQTLATTLPMATAPTSLSSVVFSDGGTHGSQSGIANGAGPTEAIAMLPVDTKPEFSPLVPTAMGNIKPWRLEVLRRIGQIWHPQSEEKPLVVVLHISRDGKLLESQIVSADSPERSEALQKTLYRVKYPPTPEWYLGRQITYKLTLTPAEAPP